MGHRRFRAKRTVRRWRLKTSPCWQSWHHARSQTQKVISHVLVRHLASKVSFRLSDFVQSQRTIARGKGRAQHSLVPLIVWTFRKTRPMAQDHPCSASCSPRIPDHFPSRHRPGVQARLRRQDSCCYKFRPVRTTECGKPGITAGSGILALLARSGSLRLSAHEPQRWPKGGALHDSN